MSNPYPIISNGSNIDLIRQGHNFLTENIGDISLLTTTNNLSVVDAVNSLQDLFLGFAVSAYPPLPNNQYFQGSLLGGGTLNILRVTADNKLTLGSDLFPISTTTNLGNATTFFNNIYTDNSYVKTLKPFGGGALVLDLTSQINFTSSNGTLNFQNVSVSEIQMSTTDELTLSSSTKTKLKAGTKTFEIASDGHLLPGENSTQNLGSPLKKFNTIYAAALAVDTTNLILPNDVWLKAYGTVTELNLLKVDTTDKIRLGGDLFPLLTATTNLGNSTTTYNNVYTESTFVKTLKPYTGFALALDLTNQINLTSALGTLNIQNLSASVIQISSTDSVTLTSTASLSLTSSATTTLSGNILAISSSAATTINSGSTLGVTSTGNLTVNSSAALLALSGNSVTLGSTTTLGLTSTGATTINSGSTLGVTSTGNLTLAAASANATLSGSTVTVASTNLLNMTSGSYTLSSSTTLGLTSTGATTITAQSLTASTTNNLSLTSTGALLSLSGNSVTIGSTTTLGLNATGAITLTGSSSFTATIAGALSLTSSSALLSLSGNSVTIGSTTTLGLSSTGNSTITVGGTLGITSTGTLTVSSSTTTTIASNTKVVMQAGVGGGIKTLEMGTTGHILPGVTSSQNLGASDKKFLKVWSTDADIVNLTATNIIANSITIPGGFGAPVGSAYLWFMPSVPTGHLVANGQKVLRADYATLFAVYGTAFATGGELITEFRLPNLNGRFPFGVDSTYAPGDAPGKLFGNIVHTHIVPGHNHSRGTLAITGDGSHTHAHSTFTGARSSSNVPISFEHQHTNTHSHGWGTGITDTEAAHSHTGVTLGTSGTSHNHGVTGITTRVGDGTEVDSNSASSTRVQLIENTATYSAARAGVIAGTTDDANINAHTHSLTIDAGGSHAHALTGTLANYTGNTGAWVTTGDSLATLNDHRHTISSSGTHAHATAGTIGNTGVGINGDNNMTSENDSAPPPAMAIYFIIKAL